MERGRELKIVCAATQNEQEPKDGLVRGTCRLVEEDDCSEHED